MLESLFNKAATHQHYLKETPTYTFSYEICEKNSYFEEPLRANGSKASTVKFHWLKVLSTTKKKSYTKSFNQNKYSIFKRLVYRKNVLGQQKSIYSKSIFTF